ncbi:hypothetical protein MHN79_01355 [Vibrio sp. Of14-4]|uniref:hypothetical protein n=1 Tax=Vibrio sp. Of14-4 TaxID=2724878 RepID=UPI001EF1A5FE|nr:hypothetical protein [Vibrio sp. Of14-4]MCG7488125.1 hypothetical protein [Vibrio sp. Of14-4]
MTCVDVVQVIKDLILAGAALTGAIVAVKGLGTWKMQLKGQSEYELSRRILVTLFRYRDAINGVRHPAMWAHEIASPSEEEANGMNQDDIKYYGTSKAYQNRWVKVQDQRTNLYTDLVEAEVIWGDELSKLFKNVFDLEHKLFTSIHQYLKLINPKTSNASKKVIKIDSEIMYDDLGKTPDNFKCEMLTAISAIEDYIKPKLNHEKG